MKVMNNMCLEIKNKKKVTLSSIYILECEINSTKFAKS